MRRPAAHMKSSGFTLVELLVSLAIAAVIVTGVFHLYTTFFRSTTVQDQVLQLQQNGRVALDDLERDLRLAGVDVVRDDPAVPDQAVFAYAAPYETVFNANLDDNRAGIRPDRAPDKVPSALPGGSIPFYDPTEAYGFAETVRWTLDADADGDVDADDRMGAENPGVYRLVRQVYGYDAGTDSNGPETAVGAEGVRGPDAYPDGTRPPVLFQYWIKEVDLNDDKIVDPGEDINGSGSIDQFLWGDDGGTAGTGSAYASNGVLDPPEITALLTGNGGNPKVIDNFAALITSTTGDARATALTRAQALSNIQRVTVTVVTETPSADPYYTASPHGVDYKYREHAVTATAAPRNSLTNVTADMSLTVSANPSTVRCPNTSSLLTISLRDAAGELYTTATDVRLITSLGSFSAASIVPSTTVTTSGGQATVSLYGDPDTTATEAVVSASATVLSEPYTAATAISYLSGPASSIQVAPESAALPADGLSTTDVTATVLDACGKPAGEGDTLNWTVSTNPPGIGGSVAPNSGTVTGNRAITTLTSGLSSGIATVIATDAATGANGGGTVNFTDCVVTVTPSSASLPADGVSSTALSLLVTDVGGVPQAGVTLNLSTDDGIVTPTVVVTDGSGQGAGALISSTTPHTATIMASVPSGGGFCAYAVGTAEVDFSDCGVTLVSDVGEVVPGDPGGQAVLTATVSDSDSGAPLSGQDVTFALTAPDGSLSPTTATTDGSGVATTTFTGGPTSGVAQIGVVTGCGTAQVDVYVRDCDVTVQASPATIPPASGNTTTITATLTDGPSGAPLAGRTVTFSVDNASLASFPAGTIAVTDANGVASVTVASRGLSGTVNVTATSECGSATVPVVINDWEITLISDLSSVPQGRTATLTATITSGGSATDPPAGDDTVTITFDAPGGLGSTVSPASGTTSGGVTTHTFTAGSTSGTVTARASATVGGLLISAPLDLVITDAGSLGDLILDAPSVTLCNPATPLMFSFRVQNVGLDDLEVTSVQFTWPGGGTLEQVKTEGSAANCRGGTNLWTAFGCGRPNGRQRSPANLTRFCKNVIVRQGDYYTFNELRFRFLDVRGEPITAVFTHQPVGGGPSRTSTITFTVPNF